MYGYTVCFFIVLLSVVPKSGRSFALMAAFGVGCRVALELMVWFGSCSNTPHYGTVGFRGDTEGILRER